MSSIDTFSTIALIDSMSNQFTKTDWKIVQFIKKYPAKFISLSAAEIAELIGTSDASIIRFAQKIGFSGFYELRSKYQKEIENEDSSQSYGGIDQFNKDYSMVIQRLFALSKEADLGTFVKMIETSKSIYICAFKQFNYVADLFADKFLMLGIKMKAITSMNEFKLYTSIASKDDLFMILNFNVEDSLLIHQIKILNKHECQILTIANYQQSKIANMSQLNLVIPKTSDLFSEFAISNNVLILMLIDLLFNTLFNSDTQHYGKILARSLELTKREDDLETMSSLRKITAFFEK